MDNCPNCGVENREEALFCRKCGEKLHTSVYIKRKEPWGIFHIGVLLITVLLLITSFGLIMGGTTLRSLQEIMTDDEGFIMSKTERLFVTSYGIVVEDMDLDIDPVAWQWFKSNMGSLRFKVITESNNPEKEIFVGVARIQDAFNYIDPIEYHEMIDMDFGWERGPTGTTAIQYNLHRGDAPLASPLVHSFWVVQSVASDSQTLVWEPETGKYYLVMMNSDGSNEIDANVRFGIEIPFFGGLGNILIISGIIVGAFGILMVYLTIRRNQP